MGAPKRSDRYRIDLFFPKHSGASEDQEIDLGGFRLVDVDASHYGRLVDILARTQASPDVERIRQNLFQLGTMVWIVGYMRQRMGGHARQQNLKRIERDIAAIEIAKSYFPHRLDEMEAKVVWLRNAARFAEVMPADGRRKVERDIAIDGICRIYAAATSTPAEALTPGNKQPQNRNLLSEFAAEALKLMGMNLNHGTIWDLLNAHLKRGGNNSA